MRRPPQFVGGIPKFKIGDLVRDCANWYYRDRDDALRKRPTDTSSGSIGIVTNYNKKLGVVEVFIQGKFRKIYDFNLEIVS